MHNAVFWALAPNAPVLDADPVRLCRSGIFQKTPPGDSLHDYFDRLVVVALYALILLGATLFVSRTPDGEEKSVNDYFLVSPRRGGPLVPR